MEFTGCVPADLEQIGAKMSSGGFLQNAFAAREEMWPPFLAADCKSPILCPKPRRICPLGGGVEPLRPFPWPSKDFPDPKAREEDLVDMLLSKGGELHQPDLTSPFFCGSPPSRATNPVVHDARFGEDCRLAPFAPFPLTKPMMSPNHSCAHAKLRSCSGITVVA